MTNLTLDYSMKGNPMTDTERFLNALFRDTDLIDLRSIEFDGKATRTYYYGSSAVNFAVEAEITPKQTRNLFVGVAARNDPEEKSGKKNLSLLYALFLDLDGNTAEELERYKKVAEQSNASMVVQSGPFGIHAYWLLASPADVSTEEGIAKVERVLKGLGACFGADPSATEVARVLRIPGTMNLGSHTKSAEKMLNYPHPCTLLWLNDNRFNLEDFAAFEAYAGTPEAKAARLPSTNSGYLFAEGSRHAALVKRAAFLRKQGIKSENEILAALQVFNQERCQPPKSDDELRSIVKWTGDNVEATEEDPAVTQAATVAAEVQAAGYIRLFAEHLRKAGNINALNSLASDPVSLPTLIENILLAESAWGVFPNLIKGLASGREIASVISAINKEVRKVKKERADLQPTNNVVCEYPLDDEGNACRFRDAWRSKLHYLPGKSRWVRWNGKVWEVIAKSENLTDMFDPVVASLESERDQAKKDQKGVFTSWIAYTKSTPGKNRALEQAKMLLKLSDECFDTHPYLLNVQDRMFDLEGWQWLSHDPGLYITQITEVELDPSVQPGVWDGVMSRVFPDSPDGTPNRDREAFQRAMGYSLFRGNPEKVFFYAEGAFDTAKTMVIHNALSVLGSYYKTGDFTSFNRKAFGRDGSAASPDLMRLLGLRAVFADEGDKEVELDGAFIKRFTGGSPIPGRKLYEDLQEGTFDFKLWMASNYSPNITFDDGAAWRRMVGFVFDVVFSAEAGNLDPTIEAKLKAPTTRKEILAWMVQGFKLWFDDYTSKGTGLIFTEKMASHKRQIRGNLNTLGDFAQEFVEYGDGYISSLDEMFDHYKSIYHPNGVAKKGTFTKKRSFLNAMKAQERVAWKQVWVEIEPGKKSMRDRFVGCRPRRSAVLTIGQLQAKRQAGAGDTTD